MSFDNTFGSRAQVWHGTAKKTSGGLTKTQLMMNKHGRIVSKRKHNTAKRENRLVKAGYVTKKGTFGFIKKDKKMKGGRHSRRKRGGMVLGGPLSPQSYDGQGVGTSGVALQFLAGNAN